MSGNRVRYGCLAWPASTASKKPSTLPKSGLIVSANENNRRACAFHMRVKWDPHCLLAQTWSHTQRRYPPLLGKFQLEIPGGIFFHASEADGSSV